MSNWHLYLGELLLPGRVPEPAAPITKATSAADLGPGPLQCCLRGLLCLLGAGQPARPQPFASSAGRSCRGSYLWDSLSAGISLHSLWLNSRYFAFRTSSSHTFNRDAKAGWDIAWETQLSALPALPAQPPLQPFLGSAVVISAIWMVKHLALRSQLGGSCHKILYTNVLAVKWNSSYSQKPWLPSVIITLARMIWYFFLFEPDAITSGMYLYTCRIL